MNRKKLSSSFCASPWTTLYTNSIGELYPCCLNEDFKETRLTDDSGKVLLADGKLSIKKAMNAPQMKKMRRQMLAGEWPAACIDCKNHEKAGVKSFKYSFNQRWAKELQKSRAVENTERNGHISAPIQKLDIKPGNLCNLSCNMCSPQFSKKVIKDFKSAYPEVTKQNLEFYKNNNWHEDEKYWKNLLNQSSDLKELHFAGGEPFLSQPLFGYLKSLCDEGTSSNIKLSFNTNLMVLPKPLLDLFPKFKTVTLHISIDGTEDTNRYIRYPAQWERFTANCKLVDKNFEKYNLSAVQFHPVIQIYNLFNIADLMSFVLNEFKNFEKCPSFFPINSPFHFNPEILPQSIRAKAQNEIHSITERLPESLSEKERNKVQKALKGLANWLDRGVNAPESLAEFIRVTEVYNKLRGFSIYDVQPKLLEILQTKDINVPFAKDPEKTKTLCPRLWNSLEFTTPSEAYMCGLHKTSKDWNLDIDGPVHLEDLLNGKKSKEMRSQFLRGEWPKACKACQQQEDQNKISLRKSFDDRQFKELHKKVLLTSDDGWTQNDKLEITVKTGNECNLSCAMCSPEASSLVAQDFLQVYAHVNRLDIYHWVQERKRQPKEFWDDIFNQTQQIQKFSFTGGEPLLNDDMLNFLERLVSEKLSLEIGLAFNTNLTVLPEKLLKLLPHFKSNYFIVGLDGVGQIQEYIRYPLNWDTFLSNCKTLDQNFKELKIEGLVFSTLLQANNIYNLTEITDFCLFGLENFKALPNLIPLTSPTYFTSGALPLSLREPALKTWQEYFQKTLPRLEPEIHASFKLYSEQIKACLKQPYRGPRDLHELMRITEVFHKMRALDFYKIQPEWEPLQSVVIDIESQHPPEALI